MHQRSHNYIRTIGDAYLEKHVSIKINVTFFTVRVSVGREKLSGQEDKLHVKSKEE